MINNNNNYNNNYNNNKKIKTTEILAQAAGYGLFV